VTFTQRAAFIDDAAHAQLLANGHRTAGGEEIDQQPVIKVFTPDAGATWLLTEIDPDDEDLAFGLCDLGLAAPELGYVRISELAQVRGRLGLFIERDEHFKADKSLSAYAEEARSTGTIRA
jgi:hypothetical protein